MKFTSYKINTKQGFQWFWTHCNYEKSFF